MASNRLSLIDLLNGVRECSHGNPEAEIGVKSIPAQALLDIYVKINLILARFPIFNSTVQDNLETLKAPQPNIFLQQTHIESTRTLLAFDLATAKSNASPSDSVKSLANILKNVKLAINKHKSTGQGFEKKAYYDPFIKYAEIVLKTTQYPIKNETLVNYLKQAQVHLDTISEVTFEQGDKKRHQRCDAKIGMELYRLTQGKEGVKPEDKTVDISKYIPDE